MRSPFKAYTNNQPLFDASFKLRFSNFDLRISFYGGGGGLLACLFTKAGEKSAICTPMYLSLKGPDSFFYI